MRRGPDQRRRYLPYPDYLYHNQRFNWVASLERTPRVVVMGSSVTLYSVTPIIVPNRLKMKRGTVVNLSKKARWYREYRDDCAPIDAEFARLLNEHLGDTRVAGSLKPDPEAWEERLMFDDVHMRATGLEYFSRRFADAWKDIDKIEKDRIAPLASY